MHYCSSSCMLLPQLQSPCCDALYLQIHSDKHGFGSGYTGYGGKVKLNEVGAIGIASAGATEDSIELMVGRDEDGKLGPGWFDNTDSEMFPLDERLRTQVGSHVEVVGLGMRIQLL